MEILDSNGGLVTLAEVREVLASRLEDFSKFPPKTKSHKNTENTSADLMEYIDRYSSSRRSIETLHEFLKEITSRFRLTQTECYQIVCFLPRSAVLIHDIIEACDQRLSTEEVAQLLDLISDYFPPSEDNFGDSESDDYEDEDEGDEGNDRIVVES